jgi:ectoine hydroxylase-related dioxygenase (phytanoyl-CoA dioxygenase family)
MSLVDEDFQYTELDHASFEREGYHVFGKCLSKEGLKIAQNRVGAMIDSLSPNVSSEWIMNTHQLGEDWIMRFASDQKVLQFVRRQFKSCETPELHDTTLALLQSQIFAKAPHSSKRKRASPPNAAPWHQDGKEGQLIHKQGSPIPWPMAVLWVPLDDVNEANGALRVIPGLHKTGLLPTEAAEHEQFIRMIDPALVKEHERKCNIVQYDMYAGQAATHHQWTPHYSGVNQTTKWRRALVLRYIAKELIESHGVVVQPFEDYRHGAGVGAAAPSAAVMCEGGGTAGEKGGDQEGDGEEEEPVEHYEDYRTGGYFNGAVFQMPDAPEDCTAPHPPEDSIGTK